MHALQAERSRKLLHGVEIMRAADHAQRPRRKTRLKLSPNAQKQLRLLDGHFHAPDEKQLLFLRRKIDGRVRAECRIRNRADARRRPARKMLQEAGNEPLGKQHRARAARGVPAINFRLPPEAQKTFHFRSEAVPAETPLVEARVGADRGYYGNTAARRLARERETLAVRPQKKHDADALFPQELFEKRGVFRAGERLFVRQEKLPLRVREFFPDGLRREIKNAVPARLEADARGGAPALDAALFRRDRVAEEKQNVSRKRHRRRVFSFRVCRRLGRRAGIP